MLPCVGCKGFHQWHNQDSYGGAGVRALGAGPQVLRAPVSPEIQQNLKTFSDIRDFKFSCFENGPPRMGRLLTSIASVGAGSVRQITLRVCYGSSFFRKS